MLAPPLRGLEGLQMRLALQSMGLKDVKLDLDCGGTEDRAKGELTLDRCALVGPGPGRDRPHRRGSSMPMRPSGTPSTTATCWRSQDSHGGAGLGPAGAGRQEPAGARPEGVGDDDRPAGRRRRAPTWRGEMRRYQPAGVLISEDMTKLLDTVARFVEQGGTLTIDAKPEPPVDIDGFELPDEARRRPGAALLGLSATLSRRVAAQPCPCGRRRSAASARRRRRRRARTACRSRRPACRARRARSPAPCCAR